MMQLTPGAATAPRRERRLPGGGEEEDAPSEPLFQSPPPPHTLIPPPWERLCPPPTPSPHPNFFFLGCLLLGNSPKSLYGLRRRHSWARAAKSPNVTSCEARRRTCRCPAPPRVSHPGSGLRRSSLCLAPPTYIMSRETQARRERFSPHRNKSPNESINSEFMQQSCNSSLNQAAQSF